MVSFLLLLLSYALVAISFTLAKAVLSVSAPIFFIAFRMLLAGACLLLYCYLKDASLLRLKRTDYGAFALIIFMHIYFAFVLDLLALEGMSSFKGAFIYNLSPFITALFSYLWFAEHMTPKKWLGLLIGFSGFLPELIAQAPHEANGNIFFLSRYELMMIGSVVASVFGWIAMRHLIRRGYSFFAINGIGMWWGGVLALFTSIALESWQPFPVTDWAAFLQYTGLIIILANFLYYNLHGYLLHIYTATFISFVGFLSPLFAAVFGWYFLGEQVTGTFFFSLFVVALGLWLFYQEELRQGYIRVN